MNPEPDEAVSLRHELVFTRALRHPPDVVWNAIIDPARLSVWWPFPATKVTIELGGSIEFVEEGTDVVRFDLEEVDGGTQLTFTHRFDRGPGPSRPAPGWHQTLDALSSALRGEVPTWLDDNTDLVAMYARHFDPT